MEYKRMLTYAWPTPALWSAGICFYGLTADENICCIEETYGYRIDICDRTVCFPSACLSNQAACCFSFKRNKPRRFPSSTLSTAGFPACGIAAQLHLFPLSFGSPHSHVCLTHYIEIFCLSLFISLSFFHPTVKLTPLLIVRLPVWRGILNHFARGLNVVNLHIIIHCQPVLVSIIQRMACSN